MLQQINRYSQKMEPEFPLQRTQRTLRLCLCLTDQNSQTLKRYEFNLPYFEEARAIRINQALREIAERGFFREAQFFLYDHINRMKVFLGIFPPINTDVMIQTQYVIGDCLNLSFRSIQRESINENMMEEENYENCCYDSKSNLNQKSRKKKQARERTIDEALEAVRSWRTLYDTADDNGKRLFTLDEAAEKVGVPKKTLDDYFMKIRVAARYDFHFEKLKHRKFGLLRNFVRVAKEGGYDKLKEQFPECLLDNDTDKYWINFDLL